MVFVVDTSYSMRDEFQGVEKLEKAIEASHKLVENPLLKEQDKVALVQFDTDSEIVQPLTSLTASGKKDLHNAIDSLRNYRGRTYMAKGLRNAYSLLKREDKELPKRVVLLTDGMTFDEDKCRVEANKLAQINAQIIALGVGDEYNQDLLIELADITKGEHYHLSDMNILDSIFEENIQKAVSEVVTDLKMIVQPSKGVELKRVARVYPSVVNITQSDGEYELGNIQKGDVTVFLLEFDIAGLKRPPSRARVARLNLWGSVPSEGKRDIEFEPIDIFVTFTTDPNYLRMINPEVMDYVKQLNIDSLIHQAVKTAQHNPQKTVKILQQVKTIAMSTGNTQLLTNVENALNEFQKTKRISENTLRTIRFTSKTRTIKSKHTKVEEIGLSDDDISKIIN
jgi:Ca-activated chloride channel family protein